MGRELRGLRRDRKRKGMVGKTGLALMMASAAFTPAIVINADVAEASSPFAGGTGTAANPYLIGDIEGLKAISSNYKKNFKIIKDIYVNGEVWTPIVDFDGEIDGGGNTIHGLTIESSRLRVGLVETLNGGIKNLNFSDVSIISTYEGSAGKTGIVAGDVKGKVENIKVARGKVKSSEGSYAGGLVGELYKGGSVKDVDVNIDVDGGDMVGGLIGVTGELVKIDNSFARGNVKGGRYAGGLIGYAKKGTVRGGAIINNVGATGNVKGERTAGGLIGGSIQATLFEGYAEGNVTGEVGVGGLVGTLSGGRLESVYATGDVVGTETQIGGLVGSMGSNGGNPLIKDAYATGNVVGGDDRVAGLVGIIAEGNLTNVYALGNVKGENRRVGGLIGSTSTSNTTSAFALNSKVQGVQEVGKAIGSTTVYTKTKDVYTLATMESTGHSDKVDGTVTHEQAMTREFYESKGFQFGETGEPIWGIDEGESVPYLLFAPNKTSYNPETGEWEKERDNNSGGGGSEGGEGNAQSQDVMVDFNGGDLSLMIPDSTDFGTHILTGDIKEVTRTLEGLTVTDARGTGEGWSLSVSASQLEMVVEGDEEGHKLKVGTLLINSTEAVQEQGVTGNLPSIAHTTESILDGGSVPIAIAGEGSGKGVTDFNFNDYGLKLIIDPSDVEVNQNLGGSEPTKYETTVEWSLVNGL